MRVAVLGAVALVAGTAHAESRVYSDTLAGLARVQRAAGVELTDERRVEVARAVASAVEGEDAAVVAEALGGGLERVGVWLAAVAVEESGLRRDVEACHVRGDSGRSVGLWQVHLPSREEREAMCGPGGIQAQARAGLARAAQCARGGARRAGLSVCYRGGSETARWSRYVQMGGR